MCHSDGTAEFGRRPPRLAVVIPALDEEQSVGQVAGRVLQNSASLGVVRVIVADNGSRDRTAQVAQKAGAETIRVLPRGYGSACLGAIRELGDWPDILVFIDADGSSSPEEIGRLVSPVLSGEADASLGYRTSTAAMTPPQKWGTRLSVMLINLLWGSRYRDMGPFRCLRRDSFGRLGMADRTWGWTIEMQIRLKEEAIRVAEVPVSWNPRLAGRSKISGNLVGVIRAGSRILWTVARYAWRRSARGTQSRAAR